jgi:hypothetical protein
MWIEDLHKKTERAWKDSEAYLNSHPDLKSKLEDSLWAFHSLGQLIPETIENVGSGHYFPYLEAFYNLQISFQLAMQAFYHQALIGLRPVLELSAMCIYYDINDKSYIEIKPWISSKIRTPSFKSMLDGLFNLDYYKRFDQTFNLRKRLENFYDELSGFVHIRGYKNSSSGLSRSNFPCLQQENIEAFIEKMVQTVRFTAELLLLKYPIGIIPLPITEKFGLNGPVGGFLEQNDIKYILAILEDKEVEFLKDIAKNDEHVQNSIRCFNELPNITDEEIRKQSEEFDRFLKEQKPEQTGDENKQ